MGRDLRTTARRWLLFERFSFADPNAVRRWRHTWPAWRRTVRPVGAVAFWLALLLNVMWPVRTPGPVRVVKGLLVLTLLTCVVIGIADYVRIGGRRGLLGGEERPDRGW